MPVVYPSIQIETAKDLIRALQRNLAERHRYIISRRVFLARHADIRQRLSYTPEYAALRAAVWERSEGVCEKCKAAPAVHLAHRIPVAMAPEKVLEVGNVYYACLACHQADHPHIKLSK